MKKVTKKVAWKCDKCDWMFTGGDPRFPWCSHKKLARNPSSISKLEKCPKKK